MAVDLHIHSTASDGTLTPAQIVATAADKRLDAIAITDHDTIAGVPDALKAGQRHGIDVFPAVEISAEYSGREVHILGYMITPGSPELSKALEKIQKSRQQRIRTMVSNLQRIGVAIRLADVQAVVSGASIGRPHLAQALVNSGAVETQQQAFRRYLRSGKPGYVDRYCLPASWAIEIIHHSHGLAVIAHPGLGCPDGVLRTLADYGLDGIEAYHVNHTPGQTRRYLAIAKRLGCITTGGTDSHGPGGPSPVEIGSVDVPDDCARQLRNWGAARGRWPPLFENWLSASLP